MPAYLKIRYWILFAVVCAAVVVMREFTLLYVVPLFFMCCCFSCNFCDNGNSPTQLQLDFAGWTNSACTSCNTQLNTTFILARNSSNACLYFFTFTKTGCDGGGLISYTININAALTLDTDAVTPILNVIVSRPFLGGGDFHRWKAALSNIGSDCMAWAAAALTKYTISGDGSGGTFCNSSVATCAATAL